MSSEGEGQGIYLPKELCVENEKNYHLSKTIMTKT